MVRTQIYLPKELHQKLTRIASGRGEPMAQLVRDLIQKGLKDQQTDSSGKQAIKNLLKIGATGFPENLSSQIDRFLYGSPKKRK